MSDDVEAIVEIIDWNNWSSVSFHGARVQARVPPAANFDDFEAPDTAPFLIADARNNAGICEMVLIATGKPLTRSAIEPTLMRLVRQSLLSSPVKE